MILVTSAVEPVSEGDMRLTRMKEMVKDLEDSITRKWGKFTPGRTFVKDGTPSCIDDVEDDDEDIVRTAVVGCSPLE